MRTGTILAGTGKRVDYLAGNGRCGGRVFAGPHAGSHLTGKLTELPMKHSSYPPPPSVSVIAPAGRAR